MCLTFHQHPTPPPLIPPFCWELFLTAAERFPWNISQQTEKNNKCCSWCLWRTQSLIGLDQKDRGRGEPFYDLINRKNNNDSAHSDGFCGGWSLVENAWEGEVAWNTTGLGQIVWRSDRAISFTTCIPLSVKQVQVHMKSTSTDSFCKSENTNEFFIRQTCKKVFVSSDVSSDFQN